ncbi:SH3 domain-containing protein [Paracoccus sediminicola]|uniref:SH3 domain-containing protein n=1 Tax=Paracoccus sediminicola TaxID=3017783 RepID=UPI0022F0C718|nr:SH3 domain-containing protein [Paracoccus sediminicola]WBU58191.1 SH3 domain-containing protein [Paracoccus sediminicola]
MLGAGAVALTMAVLHPAHALSKGEEDAPSVAAPAALTTAPATAPAPAAAVPKSTRPETRPTRLAAVKTDATQPPAEVKRGPVTRLPIPRYVSLKGEEGNVRRGPSLSHRIDWVFRHSGMPLRVVGEYGHWRRIEDRDGAGGWIHYQLLSGVRTAIVQQEMVELRSRPDLNAGVIAKAEGGAIVRLGECDIGWCRISGAGAKGWVQKSAIWGVEPAEIRN